MKVIEFAATYLARLPRIDPANEHEIRLLGEADGVTKMELAPAKNSISHIPERQGDTGCHLWVFNEDEIPYVLERLQVRPPLASGVVKHTNLTGGGVACCGGELWFETENAKRLYVNGCSGRYGPETEQELIDAVEVFYQLGYDVVSFGWDQDANRPRRVLRNVDAR